MSFGKMKEIIELVETKRIKDKDGFTSTQDIVLAKVRLAISNHFSRRCP